MGLKNAKKSKNNEPFGVSKPYGETGKCYWDEERSDIRGNL